MKKFLITILAFIYLGVSSGIAMNIRYCMGKISSVDFFKRSDKCNKCGMKASPDCCKDEFKIVKLTDSHKLISNDVNISAPVIIIDNPNGIFEFNIVSSNISSDFNNHSPPRSQGISLNILYSVFRI